MKEKTIQNESVEKKEVSKPFRFKMYNDNLDGMTEAGFDPFDFAKAYSSGDYEAVAISNILNGYDVGDQLFLPLKVKVAWFKEKYPDGYWTFGDLYTLNEKSVQSIFVKVYIWKNKSDVKVLSEQPLILNADAEGVGHVNIEIEQSLELVYSRALNKGLSSLGFDVPLTELDHGEFAKPDKEEVVKEEEIKEEQLQIALIKDEEDKEVLDLPELNLEGLQVKKEEEKSEVKKETPKRPATKEALKRVNEKKAEKKEKVVEEKPKSQPKVTPQAHSNKEIQLKEIEESFKPTLEEAMNHVVKYKNPEGKTLKELVESEHRPDTSLVNFYANSKIFIDGNKNQTEKEREERIKDRICAQIVWNAE